MSTRPYTEWEIWEELLDLNGLQLNGVVADGFMPNRRLSFRDSIIGFVGRNGSGKTTTLQSVKNCIRGISASKELPNAKLEVSLPIGLWGGEYQESDPGILKALCKVITSSDEYDHKLLGLHYDAGKVNFGNLVERIEEIWESRITEHRNNFIAELRRKEWNFDSENLGKEEIALLRKREQVDRVIRLPKTHPLYIEHDEDFSNQVLSEDRASEARLFEQINSSPANLNLLIEGSGNKSNPKWRMFSIRRFVFSDVEKNSELKELLLSLAWPHGLSSNDDEWKQEFGPNAEGWAFAEDVTLRNISARFLDDEFLVSVFLGETDENLGLEVTDIDEIDWSEACSDLLDSIYWTAKMPKSGFRSSAYHADRERFRTQSSESIEGKIEIYGSDGAFTPHFKSLLNEVANSATTILHSIIPSSPSIVIVAEDPRSLNNRNSIKIGFGNLGENYIQYEFQELSDAQKRWSKFALALAARDFRYNIILIDEPERGLQRTLERNIFNFKKTNSYLESQPILIATHSAELIAQCDQLFMITVISKLFRAIDEIPVSVLPYLDKLEISPEEWAATRRAIIITEGENDKALLDGFAENEFSDRSIEIIQGGGINSWAAYFDTQLFRNSSVKFFFLADGLDPIVLEEFISEHRNLKTESNKLTFETHAMLKRAIFDPLGQKQLDALASLIIEAIRQEARRIYFASTGDPDCLYWLPPASLGLTAEDRYENIMSKIRQANQGSGRFVTGRMFKEEIKEILKRRGIKDGLTYKRLYGIATEMRATNQVPRRVKKMLDEITALA